MSHTIHRLSTKAISHQAVFQFLKEQGYDETLRALQLESKLMPEESSLQGHQNILIAALTGYAQEAKHNSNKQHDSEEDSKIEARIEGYECPTLTTKVNRVCPDWHGNSNIIAVAACRLFEGKHYVMSAAVDGTLRLLDPTSGLCVCSLALKFPVLSLAWHPSISGLLAVGTLSGSVFLVSVTKEEEQEESEVKITVKQKWDNHNKYVVAVCWSADGNYLVTGAHDCRLVVYQRSGEQDEKGNSCNFEKLHQKAERGAEAYIESLVALQEGELIGYSVRGDYRYRILSCASGEDVRYINLNANGDLVCSFTVLHAQISFDSAFILLATDTSRLLLLDLNTGKVVRTFYGATNGDYSNPRCCFVGQGHVAVLSSSDHQVYVWDIRTEQVVLTLKGHTNAVRDLCYLSLDTNPSALRGILITCSYDKSLRVHSITS